MSELDPRLNLKPWLRHLIQPFPNFTGSEKVQSTASIFDHSRLLCALLRFVFFVFVFFCKNSLKPTFLQPLSRALNVRWERWWLCCVILLKLGIVRSTRNSETSALKYRPINKPVKFVDSSITYLICSTLLIVRAIFVITVLFLFLLCVSTISVNKDDHYYIIIRESTDTARWLPRRTAGTSCCWGRHCRSRPSGRDWSGTPGVRLSVPTVCRGCCRSSRSGSRASERWSIDEWPPHCRCAGTWTTLRRPAHAKSRSVTRPVPPVRADFTAGWH